MDLAAHRGDLQVCCEGFKDGVVIVDKSVDLRVVDWRDDRQTDVFFIGKPGDGDDGSFWDEVCIEVGNNGLERVDDGGVVCG